MRVSKFLMRCAILLALGSARILAQPLTTPVTVAPDCLIFFDYTAVGNSANFDNRFLGCDSWTVSYTATGFATLSLIFQDSPDANGAPGGFVNFAGTVVSGVNPNVAITQASTLFKGYYPWLRVRLDATTGGPGRVRGTFFGYRSSPTPWVILAPGSTVTANQGTANTAGNRWPIYLSDGANPQGVVANPLFNRLSDGAAAQGVVANPLFARLSDGAAAQGTQANPLFGRLSDGTNPFGTATNPIAESPYLWDGTAWVVQPVCNLSAAITFAGAGTTQIVALVAGQRIRVCHISFSLSGASNATIIQGTGGACAVPTALSGAYTNILGLALDFGDRTQLQTTVANGLCVTLSAAVTGGGLVTYAQY